MDLMKILETLIADNYLVEDDCGEVIFNNSIEMEEEELKNFEMEYGNREVTAVDARIIKGMPFLVISIGEDY